MPSGPSTLPVSSSHPPEFPAEALDCYKKAVEALRDAAIPFTVGGAFALHKHTGIWRSTKDLDIVLEASVVPAALRQLEMRGFSTCIEDPVWLAKAFCGDYFVDLITALGNAALVVDATWIARAEQFEMLNLPCRILAAEELLASKIFVSRRERFDGADVAHIIRVCGGRLDWERIQHLLSGHEEMLLWGLVFFSYIYPAHVDLIPGNVWSGLLRGFEHHLKAPKRQEPFRGTLIDPNMFAIDVKEWGERDLYREYCEQHPHLLQAIEPNGRRQG